MAHAPRRPRFPVLLGGLALSLLPAACGGGGGGGAAGPPRPDPLRSSFTADTPFGATPDGTHEVLLTVVLADAGGAPLEGVPVELRAGGYGTLLEQPLPTDADGRTVGRVRSTVSEAKTIDAVAYPGAGETLVGTLVVDFLRVLPGHHFVRATGSDANDGRAPLRAWRTLPFALAQVGPGDTLHVGAGTYEAATISTVATAGEPLRVLADVDGAFTGDPGEVVVDGGGGDFALRLDGAAHVLVRGFTLRNALPGAAPGGGVHLTTNPCTSITVSACAAIESTRGLDVEAGSSLTLEGNRVSANAAEGIRLGATADSEVLNNLVYANGADGLLVDAVSTDLTVGLNTFHRNGGDQIAEAVTGSTAFLSGNILTEGAAGSYSLSANTSVAGGINLSFANSSLGGTQPVANQSIEADPLFVDPFGPDGILGGAGALDDDFRLLPGSPARDAGIVDARELPLGSSGPAAAFGNGSGGLRDGEGADLDRINLGYHYTVPVDPYRSAALGETRLGFVRERAAGLSSATRSAGGAWAGDGVAMTTNSRARWVVHRLAPSLPEELVGVLAELEDRAELHLRHWDGRRWSAPHELAPLDGIDLADVGERGFDIAYESLSNEALVVVADGGPNPVFRTMVDGVLGPPAPVFATAPGWGRVLWIRLVSERGSDRVALVALDDQQVLSASVWDGDAWTRPIVLDTQVVELRGWRPFDVAWESVSGDLLVAWGFSVFAEQARYAVLPAGGAWQTGFTFTNSEAVGSLLRLSADPTSDHIAAAFGEGSSDDDVAISMWTGSAWEDTVEPTLFGVPEQHTIEVGWIGNTGKAFALWREPDGATFHRALYDQGDWRVEAPLVLPGVGEPLRVEVLGHADEDHSEVFVLDADGDLFALEVRAPSRTGIWSLANGGAPLATGCAPQAETRAFAAGRRAR